MTNSLGLAREVLELAVSKKLWIATAESLTAGTIAGQLAAVTGASRFLLGGIISYQDEIKLRMLDVSAELLRTETSVSGSVAQQMAVSARSQFAAASGRPADEVVAVSATGVAGPDSVAGIPAGKVFVGVSSRLGTRQVELQFSGQRNRVRELAVRAALGAIREELRKL